MYTASKVACHQSKSMKRRKTIKKKQIETKRIQNQLKTLKKHLQTKKQHIFHNTKIFEESV